MDIKRLKSLSGINESITNDTTLNMEIEEKLSSYSGEEKIKATDALDILYHAKDGITGNNWINSLHQLYPDDQNLKDFLKRICVDFKFIVAKTGPGIFKFDDLADVNPHFKDALSSSINFIQDAIDILKKYPNGLQLADWVRILSVKYSNLPPQGYNSIIESLNRIIDQYRANILKNNNGYVWFEEKKKINFNDYLK